MKPVRRRRKGKLQISENENKKETSSNTSDDKIWMTSFVYTAIALAVVTGLLNSMHLSTLFENDRFFSHLSSLERELSFRTEMGMYYSYYKRMVESPSLSVGVVSILHDNLTEYPDTINTLKRFNLYPEVTLSILYRLYDWILGIFSVSGVKCLPITRGDNTVVQACNGMGDAAYFYIHMIFSLNSLLAFSVALLGTYLSDSVWGGVLSITAFFYNHGQATRVMWTPPLRESFAVPFLLLQNLILSIIIRRKECPLYLWLGFTVTTIAFLLPWQFSQFTVLTQVLSVMVVHSLRLISSKKFLHILSSLTVAFTVNVILQFGNLMLLTSFLPSSLFTCFLVALLSSFTDRLLLRPIIMIVEVGVVITGSVLVKVAMATLLGAKEDEHIISILLSKFTSYSDFHTRLYTCAAEFDFLPLSYVTDLSLTLLIPMALVAMTTVAIRTIKHLFSASSGTTPTSSARELSLQVYHFLQTMAYVVMTTLIMRLKLFLTPQLAIMIGLLPQLLLRSSSSSSSYWGVSRSKVRWVIGGLILCSSVKGLQNINYQHSIIGEYNNPEGEQLVKWIVDHTPQTAVFAGTMPTMAAVLLSSGRPVVNHPHYETAALRNRSYHVYTIFSRKPVNEIHSILMGLGADYVISEDSWCSKHNKKPGCSFSEIWDSEDPANQGNPKFCQLLQSHTPLPFKLVYTNRVYRILQIRN